MLPGDLPPSDDLGEPRAVLEDASEPRVEQRIEQRTLASLIAAIDAAAPLDSESSDLNFVDERRRRGWPVADVLVELEQDVARTLGFSRREGSIGRAPNAKLERVMNRLVPLVVCRYSHWTRRLAPGDLR